MGAVASLIADMVRSGVDADLIGRAAQLLCEREPVRIVDEAAERRRASDRERKKQERLRTSADSAEETETPPLMVPLDKEKVAPKEINPPLNPPRSDTRATRLPNDFRPPPDWIGDAVALGFSEDEARNEADRFRDHWVAKAGKDGRKLDWRATWRNWCRNALEWRSKPSRPNGGTGGGNGRFADPVEVRNRLQRELAEAEDVPAGGRLLRGSGVG